MFAFAFVFHLVTRPERLVPAHFDAQLAALAPSIDPDVPTAGTSTTTPSRSAAPARPLPIATPYVLDTTTAAADPSIELNISPASATLPAAETANAIEALAWPAASLELPPTIDPAVPVHASRESGAVTRAFTATRSTLRNVFKKTF